MAGVPRLPPAGQHGVPALCAVPASRCRRQRRLRPAPAPPEPSPRRDRDGASRRCCDGAPRRLRRRRIYELSGGQQQRVALARALVNRPAVLLLDEPLAALDRKLRRDMQIELQNLQREVGITFVLVTHDQEEALSMSDIVCVMRERPHRAARHAAARSMTSRPASTSPISSARPISSPARSRARGDGSVEIALADGVQVRCCASGTAVAAGRARRAQRAARNSCALGRRARMRRLEGTRAATGSSSASTPSIAIRTPGLGDLLACVPRKADGDRHGIRSRATRSRSAGRRMRPSCARRRPRGKVQPEEKRACPKQRDGIPISAAGIRR